MIPKKSKSAATLTSPTGRPVITSGAPSWLVLEPDPVSAKTARVFARTELAGDPRGFVDDVEMVVDELTANVVVHASKGHVVPPGVSPLIHLSLQVERRWVLIGVRDPWPGIPLPHEPGETQESGRGLMIVEALAAGCWVEVRDDDKTVYALVLRPGKRLRAGELDRLRCS
jgi:anti-sigma regulatory factor (Ser/Thr protein kinase)